MLKWTGGIAIILILLGISLIVPWLISRDEGQVQGAERPDIIFIVIETLRADRVRLWGGPRHTMPNLEDAAAESYIYQETISAAPWTLPSVSSILTGLSPSAHGVTAYEDVLHPSANTLPERLKEVGYETAFFGVNSLFEADRGVDQGFDTYYGIDEIPGTQLLAELDGYLRHRERSRPLFLYVHIFEPHCRYQPPDYMEALYWPAPPALQTGRTITEDQWRTMHECFQLNLRSGEPILEVDRYLAAYDAELRYADHLLGVLLERLKAEELYDNALLAITGDHGEAFWEQGDFGHGRTLNEAVVRVPLIIRPPGGLDTGAQTISAPTSLLDLAPTALTQAGAALEPPLQGQDQSVRWREGDSGPLQSRVVFTETDYETKSKRGAYQGDSKLILPLTGEPATLESISKGHTSRQPAPVGHPLVLALKQQREESQGIASELGVGHSPLDPEDIENLRRLGYLE